MDIPFENQYSSSEFEKHLSENLRPQAWAMIGWLSRTYTVAQLIKIEPTVLQVRQTNPGLFCSNLSWPT